MWQAGKVTVYKYICTTTGSRCPYLLELSSMTQYFKFELHVIIPICPLYAFNPSQLLQQWAATVQNQ